MGLDPLMITRVGEDERGNRLLAAMGERNLRTEGVQSDPSRFTGEVVVTIDEEGHPQFDIRLGQAWDGIDADEALANLAGQQPQCFIVGRLPYALRFLVELVCVYWRKRRPNSSLTSTFAIRGGSDHLSINY